MSDLEIKEVSQRAVELFLSLYNCAQAVFGAFSSYIGVEEKEALRLASPFGGGFGRLREVCGAFSGMNLVLGKVCGYEDVSSPEKDLLYPRVQELARRFQSIQGSIICKDILKNQAEVGGKASPRTKEFYAKRPCAYVVEEGARILCEYLTEENLL